MDEVLYLIPGLICDHYAWSPQAEALAQAGVDVRIADLRGFDSLVDMARHVLTGAPDRFAIAGHSMGGRVAIEIMRLASDRVTRLAMLNTGVHPRRDGEAEKRQVLVNLAKADGMTALAHRWLLPMVYPPRLEDKALKAGLVAMVERMSPEIFEGHVRALLNRPDARPFLSEIKCPVLLGVGRQDEWAPLAQHEDIASLIPQARLVVFDDSGHMAPVETPEPVTAAIKEWLAG